MQTERERIRAALHSLPANAGSEKIVSTLLATAKGKQKAARIAAIELLGEVKTDSPEVVEFLIAMAQNAGKEIVKASVTALCRRGAVSPEVIEAITHGLEITTDSADWEFRQTVLEGLERWEYHHEIALQMLRICLSHPYWHVEMQAAEALIRVGGWVPELYDCIVKHLYISEWQVAISGAMAKCEVLPPDAVSFLFNLAEQNLSRADNVVPEVLGEQGKRHSEIVDRLLAAAQNKDWKKEARCIVLKALGKTGQARPDVVEALLTALQDEEVLLRLYAAEALGQVRVGGDEVVAGLLKGIHDDNQWMRRNVVTALGKIGDTRNEVKQALLIMLQHDSSGLVMNKIPKALENSGLQDAETLGRLLKVLQSSATKFMYYAPDVAQALGAWKEGAIQN